jgi:integrase/recombinase XerD
MLLGKQAKILSKGQAESILGYLTKTRRPQRNRLIFLLSAKAGLRAKEIAPLTWWMTNDSQGEIGRVMCLQDWASKGKSGRMIPISDELRTALNRVSPDGPNCWASRDQHGEGVGHLTTVIVNLFHRWYRHLGFEGCSSHSGSRTFITNAARKISTVGGSLRDVQVLAGHSNLRTTQRYIEENPEARARIV